MSWSRLPRALQLYIIFLVLAATSGVAHQIVYAKLPSFNLSLLVYCVLALLTAGVNVKIPYTDVHFSMDTAFVYAVLMLFGPLPAMAADGAAKLVNTTPHIDRTVWYKIPFNIASGVLSVYAAGMVYYALLPGNPTYAQYILPAFAMTLTYFLVNSWTVAVAIGIATHGHLLKLWIDNFLWTGIGFFAALSIAVMIYLLDHTIGYLAFLVSVPIISLVLFTQRVYLKREEDSKSHIAQLEAMHLSTIETLSLAIDAKDQITHGHVHRVTAYVTKLAEFLGVDSPAELKGLRFAALVHDIGKIGIPDLILTKPGRFTSEEMERMRMHPVIGAQIVKAVSYEFPIAEVVLSHHERWDGEGYPRRLRAEKINRFSRMLAICDVYDALRSDRPYRRAMNKETALNIIREERARAFDPEITDVFMTRLADLEAAAAEEDRRLEELTFSTPSSTDGINLRPDQSPLELYGKITYTQQEVFLMYEVAQAVSKGLPAEDLAAALVANVARLVPYNTAIVFLANRDTKNIEPLYIESRDTAAFASLHIAFGQGASGWVAENGLPMRNIEPSADLAGTPINDQVYQSLLSVPLRYDGKTVGVVTFYSEKKDFYQERHQDLLNKLCSMVSPALVSAVRGDRGPGQDAIDSLTGLGNLRAMQSYFRNTLDTHQRKPYGLLLLDVRELEAINRFYGHDTGDRVLKAVAETVVSVLRPEDRCFRCGGDELAVVAHDADKAGVTVLAKRVKKGMKRLGVKAAAGVISPIVAVGAASFPEDGINTEELWRVADHQLYREKVHENGSATLDAEEPETAAG